MIWSATSSICSSMLLIMRGLKAAETIRRNWVWRGLSVLTMEPKYSNSSSGISAILVEPLPDW